MCRAPRWTPPVLALLFAFSSLGLAGCSGETMSEPESSPGLARAPADPTVGSTVPSSAPRDTTLDVQVIGTGFDQGSTVEFALGGVVDPKLRVNGTRYVKSTLLIANVTIAPDAEVARYDVHVTTSKGKKGIGTERFAVTPILALPLAGTGEARDVNDAGVIVGQEGTAPENTRPFVWSAEIGLHYLPMAAPGACFQTAWAVNNQGVILGSNGCGPAAVPVRWVPDGSGTWRGEPLGVAPDGRVPEAVAINDLGQIVGVWLDASTNVNHPYLWTESAGWQPLQTPTTAPSCYVSVINDVGQMVGGCEVPGSGQTMQYLWTSPSSVPLGLTLPMPAGHVKFGVTGINDAGVLVGWSITCNCSRQIQRALRWSPSATGYTLTDLGDLGGGEAKAEAVNDAGQIVGRSSTSSKTNHAFLWTPGVGMRDLGALGSQDSWAFELSSGEAAPLIVVGRSMVNSTVRAVRWVY